MDFSINYLTKKSFLSIWGGVVALVNIAGVFGNLAYANSESQLLKFKAEGVDATYLKVELDDKSDILSFKYYYKGNQFTEITQNTLDSMPVMYKQSGMDVFKLGSKDFNPNSGGHLEWVYLHDGLTGSYQTFEMELVRTGNEWSLQVQDGNEVKKFNLMNMKMRKTFGQIVGVESVSVFESRVEIENNFSESKILRITSDAMSGYGEIATVVDGDSNFTALRYYGNGSGMKEFNLNQLHSGVVLLNQSGYDVIKLQGVNLNSSSGGVINLIYLINGITRNTGTFQMELVRSGTRWYLQTNDQSGRREFTSMYMAANKFFGKVVGIESVEVH